MPNKVGPSPSASVDDSVQEPINLRPAEISNDQNDESSIIESEEIPSSSENESSRGESAAKTADNSPERSNSIQRKSTGRFEKPKPAALGLKRKGTFRMSQVMSSKVTINYCFVSSLLLTVALGSLQLGYFLSSWNATAGPYGKKEQWDAEEFTNKITIVQTVTVAGGAISSMLCGNVAFLGCRMCLIMANVLVIFGSGITLVSNFVALCIGRFVYGAGIGGFIVYVPKFIFETAPPEISGPAGALNELLCATGVLVAFLIGLGVGDVQTAELDSFEIQHYWRVILAVPILIAAVQMFVMTFVFPFDTPVFLRKIDDYEKLEELMKRIYGDNDVATDRIDDIPVDDGNQARLSCSAVLCDKRYRRATFMGCILTFGMQLTGINAIWFYGNTIFSGLDMQANVVVAIMGGTYLLGTMMCLVMLFKFGRKTLMVAGYSGMVLSLGALSGFQYVDNSIGSVVSALIFFMFIAHSATTVTWLYVAEIMRAEAMAVAFGVFWLAGLLVSMCVPYIFQATSVGTLFLIFACCTLVNLILIAILMKETKGKSQKETEVLYRPEESEEEEVELKKVVVEAKFAQEQKKDGESPFA